MVAVHRYSPQSVKLSSDQPIRRHPIFDTDRWGRPVSDRDRSKFDSLTVFYDVFMSPSGDKVTAIGPPLLNLKIEILPLEVFINGRRVPGRICELRYHWTYSVKVPDDEVGKPLTVLLRFRCFEKALFVGPFPFSSLEKRRAVNTLQKNNLVPWISDWIRWHSRLHSFGRILLYDNGSENLGQLVEALSALDDDLEVILVEWAFPYGPPWINAHKFAQLGALNHCRLFFSGVSSWILFVDIDEYLFVDEGIDLERRLEVLERRNASALLLGGWTVPDHGSDGPPDRISVRDFWYRDRKPDWHGRKYLYRPDRVFENEVHSVVPYRPAISKIVTSKSAYRRIANLISFTIPSLLQRWLGVASGMSRARVTLEEPIGSVCFFHFRGLNLHWKYDSSSLVQDFDDERHERDQRVANLAERIGIGEREASIR